MGAPRWLKLRIHRSSAGSDKDRVSDWRRRGRARFSPLLARGRLLVADAAAPWLWAALADAQRARWLEGVLGDKADRWRFPVPMRVGCLALSSAVGRGDDGAGAALASEVTAGGGRGSKLDTSSSLPSAST